MGGLPRPEVPRAHHDDPGHSDDNLVLSTDWPHDDSRFPHSIDSFLALPYLSSETKRKVLWDNCARLYNLQPVSVESPGGN